jgi:hypothetical protein
MSAEIIQFVERAAAAKEAKELAATSAPGALNRYRAARAAKLEARLAIPKEKLSATA